MAAEGKAIYFTAAIYLFISSAEIKDQPRDLNQTWPVGRKWCRFTNAPRNLRGPSPNLGHKEHQILDHFAVTSTLYTAYLRTETSHWQTKMLMSIYNVSPKSWPTFRDLWPRNGWGPFRHCDPPYGGHYVATIIVHSSLTTRLQTEGALHIALFMPALRGTWYSHVTNILSSIKLLHALHLHRAHGKLNQLLVLITVIIYTTIMLLIKQFILVLEFINSSVEQQFILLQFGFHFWNSIRTQPSIT